MSTLVAPLYTTVSNIPLGRRIREIMKDKGMAFTLTAMSNRLGVNRETLRKMLSGEREIYSFELDKLVKELSLSVERIMQEDITGLVSEMDLLLENLSDIHRAKELAEHFLSIAIGVTEKCEAHIYMGRVFFEFQQYELSHRHRALAFEMASTVNDTYGDNRQLNVTIRNLLTTFTVRKDYANAAVMLEKAKEIVDKDPRILGEIHYTLAMIAYDAGRLQESKDHLIQSYEYYRLTDDERDIGIALHNVAFIEYKLSNMEAAKEMFEQAVEMLQPYGELSFYSLKDYAKTLFKLGEREEAVHVLEDGLEKVAVMTSEGLKVKFLLLNAIYKGEMEFAVQVLSQDCVEERYKLIACKILMDYYRRQGDSESLMKYYIKAEELSLSDYNKFGEEDL